MAKINAGMRPSRLHIDVSNQLLPLFAFSKTFQCCLLKHFSSFKHSRQQKKKSYPVNRNP
jgi:hypothetical protein